jgi:hypothetical protein
VLRPVSQAKKVKPFCHECHQDYLVVVKNAGGEVHERVRKEMVFGIERSSYRTDQ